MRGSGVDSGVLGGGGGGGGGFVTPKVMSVVAHLNLQTNNVSFRYCIIMYMKSLY